MVIVGAGLAGATAALTLRREGFDGPVTLVGEEAQPPYHRPPLSKAYLRGEERLHDVLVAAPEEYARRAVDLRVGTRAVRIDARLRVVELDGGEGRPYERVRYDRLLVTTGSRNRRLPVPGANLDGILQLRTIEQSDRIQAEARPGRRAVLVGMGFVGCEVAASLRGLGVEVAAVERQASPLARVLGEEVGAVLADVHRRHGVDVVLADAIEAFEGRGRVQRVRTKGGRTLECDFAVVGIGVIPNTELLQLAGAAVDNGIVVDSRCRTTISDVYAAGDITNHPHPVFGRLRVEHWNNAFRQGEAAALAMLDRGGEYDYLHSFWSEQYEHKIEYLGFAERWDQVVLRGSPAGARFLAFYLRGGVVRAAFGLDRGGDPEDPADDGELKACAPLIRDEVRVDPVRLADEAVELGAVAAD
jgi:3-phenylpropionate/trans-cinnamate dioxygenase ferredoxin reductase component